MGESKIEWTDATWNPVLGCSHASPGCDNCYAESLTGGRLKGVPAYAGLAVKGADGRPRFTGELRPIPGRLDEPLRKTRPRMFFVNSMSDLFHPKVPREYIAEVFAVMSLAEIHTFQVLTKRPAHMKLLLNDPAFEDDVGEYIEKWVDWMGENGKPVPLSDSYTWPCQNVWLGASIESDKYVRRADHLRDTLAAVRFISAEPLLGPLPSLDLTDIDWLIVGGESGPDARPMHPRWVRELQEKCETFCPADTDGDGDCAFCASGAIHPIGRPAFFFKQWGEWAPLTMWVDDTGESDHPTLIRIQENDDLTRQHTFRHGPLHTTMVRLGKRDAGRSLDGRTWDEMP